MNTPPGDDSPDVTGLLVAWSGGDENAFEQLAAVVERDLLRLARSRMRGRNTDAGIEARELVQEAYIRLLRWRKQDWQNRGHFYAVVAKMMRRVLVTRAEQLKAGKRGGDALQVTFSDLQAPSLPVLDVAAVDQALTRLAQFDEHLAHIVELRFFAGLTEAETAEALQVPLRSLQRDWSLARAWLLRSITGGQAQRSV